MSNKQKPELWLKKADKIATYSKDQSTKVGALFTDKNNFSPITWGYNGMSRGLPDNDIEKNKRPEKYKWIEHAERNAIYNLAQAELTNSMIICTLFPNMEAARAIVNVGIKTVFVKSVPDVKINDDVNRVKELFNLCKVKLMSLDSLTDIDFPKRKKISDFMEFCDEYANDFGSSYTEKSASMIINPTTFTYIAIGENGSPPTVNVPDNIPSKEISYWIQEPEKNAIFNFLRPKLSGSHGYVSWCPCAHCSLAIASIDCEKVYSYEPDFSLEAEKRWQESFEHSKKTMKSHGVELILMNKEDVYK